MWLFGGAAASTVIPSLPEAAKPMSEVFELTCQENGMFTWYSGYNMYEQLARNISQNNALLQRLKDKNALKKVEI